jgi:electron transport complex protein RnfA
MTGASWLAALAVFSGLSMNLILQFGLGLRSLVKVENIGQEETSSITAATDKKKFLAGLGILGALILLLWLVFSLARSLLPLGFFEFILLFPASYLAFYVFEYAAHRVALAKAAKQGKTFVQKDAFVDSMLTDGMFCGAALFITLNVADSIVEAVVLSLGFTLGIALTVLIVGEIRRRSEMENVPQFLRGGPLALISMGLLSLVFSSAAVIFFEVLVAK